MKSILNELYLGNIAFDGYHYDHDSPFVKAAKKKMESYEQLEQTLTEAQKELLETYLDAQSDIEGISRQGLFTAALKFGALLMIEIFQAEQP